MDLKANKLIFHDKKAAEKKWTEGGDRWKM